MKSKARQQVFGFTNLGGKRRGAGRKPKGERAGVSHARRPRLCSRHPVLVTMRLRAGLPSLRRDAEHAVVRRALVASSGESFQVVVYSVQSNHVHLLVEAQDERALSRGMNSLAVRLVRRLKKLWRSVGAVVEGSVLADRYHARILETPREVRNAIAYVLNNGRKHGSWRGGRPDPCSSGSGFDGWSREVREARGAETESGSVPWEVRARTWLLSIGWRRHGLIDPLEVPGSGRGCDRRGRAA